MDQEAIPNITFIHGCVRAYISRHINVLIGLDMWREKCEHEMYRAISI